MGLHFEVKQDNKFKFVEEGEGQPLLLLHGLFGAMSNFAGIIDHFRHTHKVIVPMLPLFELDLLHTTVGGLEKYLTKFIDHRGYKDIHLLGNSLGGHVGLVHVLKSSSNIRSLILTGSSGLFENGMGDTYPKRGDYEYIRKKTEMTFYDPNTASKELVDEVYQIVNERMKTLKVISLARSAIKNNLGDELKQINLLNSLPTKGGVMLSLFPQMSRVGNLICLSSSPRLFLMEVPGEFNVILANFLQKFKDPAAN